MLVASHMTRILLMLLALGSAVVAEPVLNKTIIRQGDCSLGTAENGDLLSVHYIGSFVNGTVFESSYDMGTPFTFLLGNGSVIQGWEQGIPGMCIEEERFLGIPPELAYGEKGAEDVIPPNTTINFEVTLLDINSGSSDAIIALPILVALVANLMALAG
mmetsp:Transcript_3462/g.7031  ORF Transcript_3462/g.7031 Transcript_3462/m.7031 type:complete len:159 (-) Transcript_3462:353-829(-)